MGKVWRQRFHCNGMYWHQEHSLMQKPKDYKWLGEERGLSSKRDRTETIPSLDHNLQQKDRRLSRTRKTIPSFWRISPLSMREYLCTLKGFPTVKQGNRFRGRGQATLKRVCKQNKKKQKRKTKKKKKQTSQRE